MNFYNDNDPNSAAWIQQLISQGDIPPGDVDSRSITEIQPHELTRYTQCHFFAGVAGWSRALQLAGWSPERPVWTASLPCQPFSTAGKQQGTNDERHLWPIFERLVRECRPPTIFGEQVASKLARTEWFPGVCLDLQALDYATSAADLCCPCAGEIGEGRIVRGDQTTWERVILGRPHIRQRLFWVADTNGKQCVEGLQQVPGGSPERVGSSGELEWVGDTNGARLEEYRRPGELHLEQCQGKDSDGLGFDTGVSHFLIPCRDGKTRRTQSGIFPLVDGIPRGVVPSGDPSLPRYANQTAEARAMRLKGYGNSINPEVAALFITSFCETL